MRDNDSRPQSPHRIDSLVVPKCTCDRPMVAKALVGSLVILDLEGGQPPSCGRGGFCPTVISIPHDAPQMMARGPDLSACRPEHLPDRGRAVMRRTGVGSFELRHLVHAIRWRRPHEEAPREGISPCAHRETTKIPFSRAALELGASWSRVARERAPRNF